jgi:hypothetical protein
VISSTASAPTIADATAGRESSQASETWYELQAPVLAQPLGCTTDVEFCFGESGPAETLVAVDSPLLNPGAGQ